MAGNNMESLLLGGDDSSSGESDSERSPAAAPIATKIPLGAPVGVSASVPTNAAPGPPAPPTASMSQSEMAQRLKSMYSPATKASGAPSPATGAPASQPIPRPTAHPHQQASVPQQQQIQQNPNAPPPTNYRPGSSTTSSGSAAGKVSSQQQPRVQHQQIPPRTSSGPGQVEHPSGGGGSGMAPQHQLPQHGVPRSASVPQSSSQQIRPGIQHQQQQPRSSGVPHQQLQQPGRRIAHGQQQQQQQSMTAPPTRPPASLGQGQSQSTTSSRSGYVGTNSGQTLPTVAQPMVPHDRAAMERERELKKQKEKFLIFTRVLMKYLEQKDPPLHLRVKAIIKECADRNRKKEPGYESVTAAMRGQLKQVVNDGYWKRAEAYLDHFLKEKAQSGSQSAMQLSGSSTGSATMSQPSSTSSSAAAQEAMKRKQAALQMQQRQHHQQDPSRPTSQEHGQSNMGALREDPNKKRQSAPVPIPVPRSSTASKLVPATAVASKGKAAASKSRPKVPTTPTGQQQRKASISSLGGGEGGVSAANGSAVVAVPLVIREYNDLMEQVDHAARYDWTSAGSLLGDESHRTLSEEQRKLLYDSRTTIRAVENSYEVPAFPVRGWSQRNVISSRVAWARLRLPEGRKPTSGLKSVGLTNEGNSGHTSIVIDENENAAKEVDNAWYNEDRAEEDRALAVLSEGAEIYIKSVLEKALHCARQRQHLDGIRLWHQQLTSDETSKPALSVQLGCDVERQVAQAVGNAAMTCKRMEEALERQPGVTARYHEINDETLKSTCSMSEAALRPKLGTAVSDAENEGKRNFDTYHGKGTDEPPFGRVPKIAKLEVGDFQTGMSFIRPGRQHRASTLSSTFFF